MDKLDMKCAYHSYPSSSKAAVSKIYVGVCIIALLPRLFHCVTSAAMSPAASIACARKVAILGSGMAGSTAARRLAEAGMNVSVFECGVGVGGRMSTRVTRDEHKFAFDHGAQYIGPPRTPSFQRALIAWEANQVVKEWKGRFSHVTAAGEINPEAPGNKRRYVGYPAMNSICKNLLDHDNIDLVLQTRACANYNKDSDQWTLTSHDDRRDLGQFDWLIGTDRLSGTNNRADLRNTPLGSFKARVDQIASQPVLVLMVAFESPLLQIPYDGIMFDEESNEFGSLGWIARDTSKPGRERDDGQECWLIQSRPKAAEQVLTSMGQVRSIDDEDFEKKRDLDREMAKEMLLQDFMAAIPKLSTLNPDSPIPRVVSAVGHRWSAAFPLVPESNEEQDSFVDVEHRFIACGDYMGKLHGRVEGAYLSGSAAATALLHAAQKQLVE